MSSALEIGEGDFGKIYDDLMEAAPQWYNLGLQLGLSNSRLDCIEKNNREIVEDCLREMLKTWFRAGQPMWKDLVDALESKSVGRKQLARKMREKYYKMEKPGQVHPSLIQVTPGKVIKIIIILLVIILTACYCSQSCTCMLHYNLLSGIGKLRYHLNLYHSISLPRKPEHFVGRDQEVQNVTDQLDFITDSTYIVSIIGGPGFGKSSLAISVGHQMLSRGVTVYYVDMTEVTSMQALADKIIEGDESIVSICNITVERMYKWARQRYYNTLLILDNCDDMLNHVKEELQKTIIKLLESSEYLKILTTSRKVILLSTYHIKSFPLNELKADASCELLKRYSKHLTATECKRIAYLTGNVPLALKVVGSLLDQPNPPHPATVIENLEKELIQTLSPSELPDEERVNACINISYRYLSPSIQLLGQYLAYFPGSFSLETAKGIFDSRFVQFDSDDVSKALAELVQRSLLQRTQLAKSTAKEIHDRFQFHRLIKDFFLIVQQSKNSKYIYFSYGFIRHFAFKLENSDSAMVHDVLDEERHNCLHFIKLLPEFCALRDNNLVRWGIHTVAYLFHERILQYYYTSSELYDSTQHIVNHLATYCRSEGRHQDCLDFVILLLQLATFHEGHLGVSQAIDLLKLYQYKVEDMRWYSGYGTIHYMEFYQQLGNYYRILKYFEKEKECHEKILHVDKGLHNCEPGSCDYLSIGNAYQCIGKDSDALYFFELALKEEHLDPIQRGNALVNIYRHSDDQQRRNAIIDQLMDLFPSLISASDLEIYKHFMEISSIVHLFRDIGKTDEADELEAKQLTVINEAAVSENFDKHELMTRAISLAKSYFEAKQYSRCVKMAELAIKLQVNESVMIALWELMADAKFFSGNHSEGYAVLEKIINYIYEHNKTDEYFSKLYKICISHRYFRCTVDCIAKGASKISRNIIFIIFSIPPNVDNLDHLLKVDYTETSSSVRQSTDLVHQHSLQLFNHALQEWLSLQYHAFSYLKCLWNFLLKFASVRNCLLYTLRIFLVLCYLFSIIVRLCIASVIICFSTVVLGVLCVWSIVVIILFLSLLIHIVPGWFEVYLKHTCIYLFMLIYIFIIGVINVDNLIGNTFLVDLAVAAIKVFNYTPANIFC